MGVPFADSFDLSDDTNLKWSNSAGFTGVIDSTPGHARTGTRCCRIGENPTWGPNVVFGAPMLEIAVAMAWKPTVLNDYLFVTLTATGTQVYLWANLDGSITVYSGAGPLNLGSTAPGVLALNAYSYLLLKTRVTTDSITGYVKLYVNGTLVLSRSGIQTAETADGVDQLDLSFPSFPAWVDDLFLFNLDDGDWNDGFLTPVSIYACLPAADKVVFEPPPVAPSVGIPLVPSVGGPHFEMVNSVPPSAVHYVSSDFDDDPSNVPPNALPDAYQIDFSGLPAGRSIVAALVSLNLDHLSGGASLPEPTLLYLQTGGAWQDAQATSFHLPALDVFGMSMAGFLTNPVDSAGWTLAELAATYFGPQINWIEAH